MTRRILFAIQLIGLFLVVCSPVAYADPFTFTFTTIPGSGDVAGPAGSTVGWGYTITNTSATNWLMTASLSAGGFLNGTPSSIFDFPIVAPGDTVSVPFDALSGFGLYQLTWDPTAPVGFVNTGTFLMSGEWWDGDPFAGGQFLSTSDASAPYSATVTGVTAVPVPSTLLLMAAGLGAIYLIKIYRIQL